MYIYLTDVTHAQHASMFISFYNNYVAHPTFLIFQLFQWHVKYVRQAERERWMQLTVDLMSEESDGDDDEFVVHKPEWQSDGKL